jgi:hypothetical protein
MVFDACQISRKRATLKIRGGRYYGLAASRGSMSAGLLYRRLIPPKTRGRAMPATDRRMSMHMHGAAPLLPEDLG